MTADRPLSTPLALGGAAAIGAMTAVQARINGVLSIRIDDAVVTALISFSVGLLCVAVTTLVTARGRAGLRRLASGFRARSIPFWMLLGGACGALTVTTQGLVAGLLGVSLFTVGVVAGQTLNGLVLDRIGFGPAGVVAVTPGRVFGGLFALAAVAVSLAGGAVTTAPPLLLLLPFIAGIGIAWQSATNGRLAQRIVSPMAATLVSFAAGTLVLAVSAAVSIAVRGMPQALPAEPWLYVGGALGFVYILLASFLVAHTGVLLLGLGSVLGQLAGSIVIDLIWPASAGPALWQLGAMIALAAASVVVAMPRRRRA